MLSFRFVPGSCAVLALSLTTSLAQAQDCDCDHEIATGRSSFDGAEAGVSPGDTVCLPAGSRGLLRISSLIGSAEQTITIKNCGGRSEIDGLVLLDTRHVRLTGSGEADLEHGILLSSSTLGLSVLGVSDHIEIDHIEITGVQASPALRIGSSFNCDNLNPPAQIGVSIHDNYLHDVGTEGIFFASTHVPSGTENCSGSDETVTVPPREDILIENNRIEDTGFNGIQVANIGSGCAVSRNRIVRTATADQLYQTEAIQLIQPANCEVSSNYIQDGIVGIQSFGVGPTRIANNLIADVSTGILLAGSGTGPHSVRHNTLVNASEQAVRILSVNGVGPSLVANNLLAACGQVEGDSPLYILGFADMTIAGNVTLANVDDALFVDAALGDYRLAEGSPAIDAGVDLGDNALAFDGLGSLRDESPDVGAREWLAPEAPVGSGGGAGTGGAGTGGTTTTGGAMNQGGAAPSESAPEPGDDLESSGGAPGENYDASIDETGAGTEPRGTEKGCRYSREPAGSSSTFWLVALLAASALFRRRRLTQIFAGRSCV